MTTNQETEASEKGENMEPIAGDKLPNGLPVYAEAKGKSGDGHSVWLLVTQSRGGRVYYEEAWRTDDPPELLGAWKTRDRSDVDYALDELRAAGFEVKLY